MAGFSPTGTPFTPIVAGVEAYEQHAGQHETRRPMFEPTSR